MSRYEQATENSYKILKELIGDHFPSLAGAKFEILFDTKKKKKDGNYRIGSIQSTNDLTKFFTADDESGEGADYIVYLDKNIWKALDKEEYFNDDKRRILFHELCHCNPDLEKENFKTRDHEIKTFYQEIKYNEDDPKWAARLSTMIKSIYEEE